ncbi:hypothetical protein Pmar_PMAR026726 [Perkinsus marinus ATCC 50983]|uniref:Uncharacterized protein n=1 Tax=Perkinsus marinus (strain ATCC 50983 / TXsc) TaxID=423536 RepID=C5K5X5_PERM5|nr:hypothetical protein Pmar_PMAR026726 [Perkinsus marinus ATCC 50983]EER20136.1 hypothetical protein Pmar_PMAR026726 [Perkinsus marinus ATCC 50983]|eukprot:XP_002788340.1 hypothetical protein Pmar_PMAR026726 [Perkinsus marinus ATCC 50983]
MDSARSDALSSLREIGRTTDDTANPSACDIIPSGTALLAMKISSSSGVASWRESSWSEGCEGAQSKVGMKDVREVDQTETSSAHRHPVESEERPQSPTSDIELPIQRNFRGWLVGEDSALQDALDRASVALAKARRVRPGQESSTSSTSSPRSEDGALPPLVCTQRPGSPPAWELVVHGESRSSPKDGPTVVHYHHHYHHHYSNGLPGDARIGEAEKKAMDDAMKMLKSSKSGTAQDDPTAVHHHVSHRHIHHDHQPVVLQHPIGHRGIIGAQQYLFRPSTADHPQRLRPASSPSFRSSWYRRTLACPQPPKTTRQFGA